MLSPYVVLRHVLVILIACACNVDTQSSESANSGSEPEATGESEPPTSLEQETSATTGDLCIAGEGSGEIVIARAGMPISSGILFSGCVEEIAVVTPSLPEGLTINSQNQLAGVPTSALDATKFEIKLGKEDNSITIFFELRVTPSLPDAFAYSHGLKTGIRGVAMDALRPTLQFTGGTYTITPDLPSGLVLDPKTGAISGTPLAVKEKTAFAVEFVDKWEHSTATLEIEVKIPAPIVSYGTGDRTIIVGTVMTPWPPVVEAEGALSFSIEPELPTGLVLGIDGAISGFPLVISASTSYAVTLTNEGGSHTINLTLAVAGETLDLSSFAISASVLPRRQGWGATNVINDRIYFYGGNAGYWGANSYAYIQSAPVSDPLAWTDEGQILPGDFGWSPSLRVGSKIYFYGSVAGTANKIYSLDVAAPLVVTDTTKTLPQNFNGGCIQVIEDEIYFFGGNSAGTNIWKASIASPSDVVDTGVTLPFFGSNNPCFVIDQYLYMVEYVSGTASGSTAKTYRASRLDPTNWTLIETKELGVTQQNAGVTLIVGEYIYLFATHMSQKIYKAPLSSPGNWVDTGATYPAIAWGSGNFQRFGNTIYLFGGNGTDYKGIDKIITVSVLP